MPITVGQTTTILIELLLVVSHTGFAAYRCPNAISRSGHKTEVYRDKCFEFVRDDASWPDAKKDCESRNGYLLEARDHGKQTFMFDTIDRLKWSTNVWFGLTDKDKEGSWVWSKTGQTLDYSNWAENQPFCPFIEQIIALCLQDCALLLMGQNGRWKNQLCSEKFPYVCEYDAELATETPIPVTELTKTPTTSQPTVLSTRAPSTLPTTRSTTATPKTTPMMFPTTTTTVAPTKPLIKTVLPATLADISTTRPTTALPATLTDIPTTRPSTALPATLGNIPTTRPTTALPATPANIPTTRPTTALPATLANVPTTALPATLANVRTTALPATLANAPTTALPATSANVPTTAL